MNLGSKWIYGMISFFAGLALGLIVILAAINSGTGQVSFMSMVSLIIALSLSGIGSIVIFTDLLDRTIKPLMEEAKDALTDDVEDIQKGRFTSTQAIVVLTLLAGLWFIYQVLKHGELSAMWGFVPVIIPTAIVAGIAMVWIMNTEWYQDIHFRMPFWIFLIPLVGILLSAYLGLNAINKDQKAIALGNEPGSVYYFNSFNSYYYADSGSTGSSVDIPECHGDGCDGYAYLFLLVILIVLTLILIIGSAIIPHFWLLAGALFLVIMWLIMLHEIKVRPGRYGRSW